MFTWDMIFLINLNVFVHMRHDFSLHETLFPLIWDMIAFYMRHGCICKIWLHETWFLLIWDMIASYMRHDCICKIWLLFLLTWDMMASYIDMIASYMRHDWICKIWLLFLYCKWDMIADNCIRLVYDMTWDMISVYTKVRYHCIW